jgi:hypothetical protein
MVEIQSRQEHIVAPMSAFFRLKFRFSSLVYEQCNLLLSLRQLQLCVFDLICWVLSVLFPV